jgi:hypothetical protein
MFRPLLAIITRLSKHYKQFNVQTQHRLPYGGVYTKILVQLE